LVVSVTAWEPDAIFIDHEDTSSLTLEVAGVVQGLAGELLCHAQAIASEVSGRVLAVESALADPDDPTSLAPVEHATHANIGAILSMLAFGVAPESARPPLGALKLFERLADHNDGLRVIQNGYRLAIRELWQIWAAFVASRTQDAELLYAVLAASTSQMDTYVDCVCERLDCSWNEARRRGGHGRSSVETVVRRVLSGKDHDGNGLSELGYPVEAEHVAIALPPELEQREVESLARRLRDWAEANVVAAQLDDSSMAWLAFAAGPTARQLTRVKRVLDGVGAVGLSEPAAGLEGFRDARREALDARRIATLRGTRGLTQYRDVALIAVLVADPVRARALARAELGPLAADDKAAARLRETIATFLACGQSHVAAAQRLSCHQKTVAYRVRQAEQLLHRRLTDRRTELEAALLVHRALGGRI
jgi:hypothetical protein